MRILLLLAVGACAPQKPEPAHVAAGHGARGSAGSAGSEDDPVTDGGPGPDLPPWRLACDGDAASTSKRRVVFDLPAVTLAPVRTGARIAQQSHAGKPRSALQIESVIERAEPMLRGCWKWAAARGATDTTIDLAFTLTPFGRVTGVSVTSAGKQSPELVACLEQTLPDVSIPDVSPRTTRMRTKLAFVRADQGRWPRPPKRPAVATAPRPKRCLPVLDNAPIDQLASPIAYTIDDFDVTRIARSGREPTVVIPCMRTGHVLIRREAVQNAVDANRGALQACFADARDRDPTVAGTIDLALEFTDSTIPSKVVVKGAGTQALHACVTAAANELWIPEGLPEGTVEVHVPLVLADASIPKEVVERNERARATAKTDRERCSAQMWIVDTLARSAPWLDDPHVLAQTKQLATLAAALPEVEGKACIRLVERFLRRVAYGGASLDHHHLRWSWIERIEAVLPVAHYIEPQLVWFHAASLAAWPPRHAEGIAKLRALANDSNELLRGLAEAELARYQQPRFVSSRTCN